MSGLEANAGAAEEIIAQHEAAAQQEEAGAAGAFSREIGVEALPAERWFREALAARARGRAAAAAEAARRRQRRVHDDDHDPLSGESGDEGEEKGAEEACWFCEGSVTGEVFQDGELCRGFVNRHYGRSSGKSIWAVVARFATQRALSRGAGAWGRSVSEAEAAVHFRYHEASARRWAVDNFRIASQMLQTAAARSVTAGGEVPMEEARKVALLSRTLREAIQTMDATGAGADTAPATSF